MKNHILRAVPGAGFEEDPLRVLRGAQFAARYDLTVDEATMEKMRRMPTDALSPGTRDERNEKGAHAECPSGSLF